MGLLDTLLGHAGTKSADKVNDDFAPLLAPGETVVRAFGEIRDLIVFTDRRLILVDKQGVTGRKTEFLSLPYRSIVMFSLETAGHFDLEAELRLWVSGQPNPIARRLGRSAGAEDIIALLAPR
ncbi:PH domain-containing protein [Lysobacter enzymogenes]|uniref:PH domain-containing protein n=1 Tax=Lysobacter enzymogenes TaxID=69 RepID=A0A3N2RNT8_LYSEN|nr:PH domain-containing protein [Lysobacter enzymogenes]ROU09135.1 PH domain-containing protein [Lysobacter enzymogenes]